MWTYCSILLKPLHFNSKCCLTCTVNNCLCLKDSNQLSILLIFHKILKKNKLLPKPSKKDSISTKKKREIEKFKFKDLQVFYNSSSHTDPHLSGAGYTIFRDEKEILVGTETIPFDTNNIGEFKGCLLRLKSARGLGSHIQIVSNCIILTKVAPKNYNISNYKLNFLLIKIKATVARFEDVEFIHIFCKLNKHADAIATTTN